MNKLEIGRTSSWNGEAWVNNRPVYLHLQDDQVLRKMRDLKKYIRSVRTKYFRLEADQSPNKETLLVIKEWIDMAFKILNERT